MNIRNNITELNMEANTNKNVVYGIDLGTHKITISKTALTKNVIPMPEVVADFMDIRKIPSLIWFQESLNDAESTRRFGNNTTYTRAIKSELLYSENSSIDEQFLDKKFNIRNTIVSHVKDIMKYRAPNESFSSVKNIAYVPKFSHLSNPGNLVCDSMSIDSIMRIDNPLEEVNNINIIPINDVNALILSYIQRYALIVNEGYPVDCSICNGCVLLVDIGYTKCQAIRFKINKKNDELFVIEQVAYSTIKIGCRDIDNAFYDYILKRILIKQQNFRFKPESLKDQIIKLKHQMSSNLSICTWFQGLDTDVSLIITRDEFNSVIDSLNFKDKILNVLLDDIKFDKVEHNMKECLHKRHIEVVGGGSRMPYMTELFETFCKEKGFAKIGKSMNPDEALADGASCYAWLYNNPNNPLVYYRYVRNKICIEYKSATTQNTEKIYVYHEGDRILSTFNDDTSIVDTGIKRVTCDVKKIQLKLCDNSFMLHFGNDNKNSLNIVLDIDLEKKNKSDFIDVYVRYNMADVFDIIIKQNDSIIKYKMYTVSGLDIVKEQDEFKESEKMMIACDNRIIKKQTLTNYFEEYYNSKDDLNTLIAKIQDSNNVQAKNRIDKIDEKPTVEINQHIKEIYEFYQFCNAYMFDGQEDQTNSDTIILAKKRRCILKLLKDECAVDKLLEATRIIDSIKKKYH